MTDTYSAVNPSHYQQHPSGIQAIQITEWFTANIAQVIQYLWRCGLKDSAPVLSELRKAVWFCNRELMRCGGESMLKDGLQGPPILDNAKAKSRSDDLIKQGKELQSSIISRGGRMRHPSDV